MSPRTTTSSVAQERIEAKISLATARYMSNAKWLALFALLRSIGVGSVRWKFINEENVFFQALPGETDFLETRFADVLPAPYAEFREIEWLEVPREYEAVYSQLHSSSKAFPWQESEQGLKLVAYAW